MDSSSSDALTQLKKAVIGQKAAALPDHPGEVALQPLHEQMVAYDRYVSETVIQVLTGGKQAAPYPKVAEVESAITAAQSMESSGRPVIEQYKNYKNRLDKMLDLAIQVAQSRA